MKAIPLFSLLVPFWVSMLTLAHADDWRSKYSTGKKGEDFEACCGIKDCRTAKSLGYPTTSAAKIAASLPWTRSSATGLSRRALKVKFDAGEEGVSMRVELWL